MDISSDKQTKFHTWTWLRKGLYNRGVWNALFFIGCYWRTDVYQNGRSPALLFDCFGRGTSVARRDQGGGLALPESSQGCCRSRYDAKNLKSAMKDRESLRTYLDASRMHDWNLKERNWISSNSCTKLRHKDQLCWSKNR